MSSVGLVAWIGGPEWLPGLGLRDYPFWPLNAVASACLAIAIAVRAQGDRGLAVLWTVPAAIIAVEAALEYATGHDLGIDRLLFERAVTAAAVPVPGRPDLLPTASLALLALALGASIGERRWSDSVVLLLASVVLGLTVLSLALLVLRPDVAHETVRLASSLPAGLVSLMLVLALISEGAERRRQDRAALLPFEQRVVTLMLPLVVIVPVVLFPAAIRLAEAHVAPQMVVEAAASALNLLVVIAVLAVGLRLLRGEREALYASERRLALAIEAHNVGVFDWDVKKNRISWSRGAEQRLGLAPGAVSSFATWARHVHPDDARALLADVAGAHEGNGRLAFRYRFTRHDGEMRQIEGSAQLLYDEHGALDSAIGVSVDVTDRERDKAQLQSIVETVPEAMVVIDAAGAIRRFSNAAQQMFGWTEAEMIGRNVSSLMPDDDVIVHDGHLRRYIAGGAPRAIGRSRQLVARKKNGTSFPIELNVGESWAAGERLFTGFIQDISERISATQRFEELRAEFAHADRSTAMGEIAVGLAHELNQPLAAAANYLSVAEITARGACDQASAAMGDARREILRAGNIIRRLRDFLAKNEVDGRLHRLAEIVEDATALALVGRDRARISVLTAIADDVEVFADRVQVQQVLVNLLRNAAEVLPGDRDGHIYVRSRPAARGMVEVLVRDDGPGLPPEVVARLYEPFVSTKRGRGMGVGLSICRRIVEAHGGSLDASNEPEGGACLRFTLPGRDFDLEPS